MVCGKCEQKLSKVPTTEKWKAGKEDSKRKINENKMLSKSKRWQPYSAKCTTCKAPLQPDYKYCQKCSYAKGLCAMCGVQVLSDDVKKQYKQSAK